MSFVASLSQKNTSMTSVLRLYPQIAEAISMLSEYVMRSDDVQFSRAERELIATYVSDLNGCDYAARTHQATAEAEGMDAAVFAPLLKDIELAPLEARLKPVLNYVKILTLRPAEITQAEVDAVFNAGWDEKSFHFATMVCGMFGLYNRILLGYGISNTDEFYRESGRRLAENGYLPVASSASGS